MLPIFLKHQRLKATVLGLLPWIALLVTVSCGTLQVSVEIQDVTPTPEWTELPGYLFAENVTLLGYSVSNLEVSPGGDLNLTLHWKVSTQPLYPYTIGIRLVQKADAPPSWQYNDNTVPWTKGYQVTHHQLHFPPRLERGDYGVEIWLQHPETGAREPVLGPDGPLAGQMAHIMTLHFTNETR